MLSLLFAFVVAGHAADVRAHVRALVGAGYDSRILIAPDAMFDQGRPTEFGDYRVVTNGDFSYWALTSNRHHFGPVAAAALVNTAGNQHAAGDPYRFSVGLPYLLDFDGTHPHQLLVRPVYQTLLMDPSLTSRKSVVQNSLILDVNNTWRTGAGFDAMLGLEYRRDDATTKQSVGPSDADANKYTARARATLYPGDKRRHAVAFDFGVIRNQAVGRLMRYDRTDLGVTFTAPAWADRTVSAGLGVYRLNFPNGDRRDLNATVSGALRVPLGGPWAAEVNALYARNFGQHAPFTYDRLSILTALSLATAL